MSKKRQRDKTRRISKRKLLEDWSLTIRTNDQFICQVCGATKYIQAHHLLMKSKFPHLQLELMNGISLCPTHHTFGKYSAHCNPFWLHHWLQANRPAQYDWVIKNGVEGSPLASIFCSPTVAILLDTARDQAVLTLPTEQDAREGTARTRSIEQVTSVADMKP